MCELSVQAQGTVKDYTDFNTERDTGLLRKALKGLGLLLFTNSSSSSYYY